MKTAGNMTEIWTRAPDHEALVLRNQPLRSLCIVIVALEHGAGLQHDTTSHLKDRRVRGRRHENLKSHMNT